MPEDQRRTFEVAITALTQKHVFLTLAGIGVLLLGVANIDDLLRVIQTVLAGVRGCP